LGNSADMVKVYNRLMSVDAITRLAFIYGVGLVGKLLWWFFISLLPKNWPDIFFDTTNGLRVTNRRKRSSLTQNQSWMFYDTRQHSTYRNLQEYALIALEEIDDKIDKVNRGIL